MGGSNDACASSPSDRSQVAIEPGCDTSVEHGDSQSKDEVSRPVRTEDVKGFILNFLATSGPESLACVFVVLAIATYVVLGRLGLLLIGLALGVVLHASWEGTSDESRPEAVASRSPRRRKELALELANRLLDWSKHRPTEGDHETEDSLQRTVKGKSTPDLDYSDFRPRTSVALRCLTDAAIRDYVLYWYGPILPSESTFPLSCRATLAGFIASVASHLSNKRTADTFLQFLMNSSSIIIVFLNELSAAFQVAGGSMPPEQAVSRYLELSPESSLSNVLSSQQQQKKLNMVAEDVLSAFLDQKAYGCAPVRNFLREVLAGVIFESTIASLSRPEFINNWIIYLFSEGESEIMTAIDAGVEGARNQGVTLSKTPGEARNPPLGTVDSSVPSSRPPSTPDGQSDRDKATMEAMIEAKRLTDMIAAQDGKRHNPQQGEPLLPGSGASTQARESASTVSSTADTPQSHFNIQTESESVKPNGAEQSQNTHEPLHAKELGEAEAAHSRSSSPSSIPAKSFSKSTPPTEETNGLPLSLHGAYVSVDDVSKPNETGTIKSKPTSEYLLQVEPFATRSTGWMVFRKYADFESLHETLATISRLNRIYVFIDQHPNLPPWRGETKQSLTLNLERYLKDALRHEPLAESGKMKRFLQKDTRDGYQTMGASTNSGLLFHSQTSFENMGKGVWGALSNAPKGVAGGGKAVFDGVSGVLGNVTSSKRPVSSTPDGNEPNPSSSSSANMSRGPSFEHIPEEVDQPGSQRGSLTVDKDAEDRPSLPRLSGSQDSSIVDRHRSVPPLDAVGNTKGAPSSPSVNESRTGSPMIGQQPGQGGALYKSDADSLKVSSPLSDPGHGDPEENAGLPPLPPRPEPEVPSDHSPTRPHAAVQPDNSITSEETQIAVELIFAVINELYSMSSVWNIRKTLLNAAKSYILRPGSPNVETIRTLLQDSMIDANTSDEAVAEYLAKLRENALPTEAELNAWPPSPSDEEKERLRVTARRVFVQRGIPQALMSVMGAAASREALEKIFDCLQVENIARGLVFSILVQGLRAVIL